MHPTETHYTEEKAENFWAAIEQHLSDTTPHAVLGVAKGVPEHSVLRAYLAKKTELIKQPHSPERQALQEKIDTAYKAISGKTESLIYTQWLNFKEYTSHNAEVKQMPIKEEALKRLEAAAEASRSFAFKKPVIALGATALAAVSMAYAVKATERIREKKEAGETPERSDRALQALGLAGAAGVISAAVLMWKHGNGQLRG